MSENSDDLRSMLLSFRVSELQMLLGFAGRNKSGRKTELQTRALELLRVRSHPIHQKIRDLHKTIQQSFPVDNLQRKLWFSLLGFEEGHKLPKNADLCSDHFDPEDIYIRVNGLKYLKSGAIPKAHHEMFSEHSSYSSDSTVSDSPARKTSDDFSRQSGSVSSIPQASSSPVTPDQQVAAAQATTMPQQQGNIVRTTATVHPYSVDTRAMTRQAAAAAAIYSHQQSIGQNMYYPPQYTNPKQTPVLASNFPVHPDVRFKRLPFYDILADLIKPSTLVPTTNQRMQEQPFYFHLTPQQATDIASSRDIRPGVKCDYIKQVQLRFCLLETTCEQEDCFPPQVIVKVNNKLCPLPNPIPTNKQGVEPKRPPRPVNITQMVKLSPTVANQITVSWAADYGRGYAMTVGLVTKLTSSDLLQRLQKKGAKHADHTRALIKEKLSDDGDCEIATTSLRVSLMCPLGKMRMATPCRPQTCAHLQCFDASLFLQMNERKPTWNCPVCDKPALYDSLVIDGYFQEVLSSSQLPSECKEIQLLKDGSWSSQTNEKKLEKACTATKSIPIDDSIEIIEDNIEIVSSNSTATSSTDKPQEAEKKKKEVVDLTLSDSDDDEPLAKRPAPDSTIKSNNDDNMPKTPASRARKYRARKKLSKRQKPPAKTGPQRNREYRARKKALRNAVAAIGDNEKAGQAQVPVENVEEIIIVVQADVQQANSSEYAMNRTSTKTSRTRKSCAQRCREYRQRKKMMEVQRPGKVSLNVSDIQVDPLADVHQANSSQCAMNPTTATRTSKSCAQRAREYRQRKKMMEAQRPGNVSSSVSDIQVDPLSDVHQANSSKCALNSTSTITTQTSKSCAQRSREYRQRKKMMEVQRPDVNMAKTPAERAREYRARKKLSKQQKPPAKTGAQRKREYRARQQALRNAVATIRDNETSSTNFIGSRELPTVNPPPSTSRDVGSILHNYLSQTSVQAGRVQVPVENAEEIIIVDVHQANSNSTTTTQTRKSCAQRSREYRQRKKMMEVQRPENSNISSSSSSQQRTTTTPGPSSVSSSGYPVSPGVINLDSPSPPRSPQVQPQALSSCMLTSQVSNGTTSTSTTATTVTQNQQNFNDMLPPPNMPYIDMENEASSAGISFNTPNF